MTSEDKQKAMLAEDLTSYINKNHTQEECVGFIDGYNAALTKLKLLGTPDIENQSEQLSLCQCYKPSPDIMYGKTCTECCLEIN